jgi:hypothetical protein
MSWGAQVLATSISFAAIFVAVGMTWLVIYVRIMRLLEVAACVEPRRP